MTTWLHSRTLHQVTGWSSGPIWPQLQWTCLTAKAKVYNLIMVTGLFPSQWKVHKTTMLPKHCGNAIPRGSAIGNQLLSAPYSVKCTQECWTRGWGQLSTCMRGKLGSCQLTCVPQTCSFFMSVSVKQKNQAPCHKYRTSILSPSFLIYIMKHIYKSMVQEFILHCGGM